MTASIADLVINSTSKQYVRVAVTEITGADPTTDNVYMAFPVTGDDPSTFITASWLTLSGIYYALCLVGPGAGITLDNGFYDVYVKISDNPEVPVLHSGLLEVT